MSNLTYKSVLLSGTVSKASLSAQDGTGRLQLRWNSTMGKNSTYIESDEPAFCMDMNMYKDSYFNIKFADRGVKDNEINFSNHLSITPAGNVGINKTIATEKLEVNGNVKCNDIVMGDITSLQTYLNNLGSGGSTSSSSGSEIFNKVYKGCSTTTQVFDELIYTGSGFFITQDESDLSSGLFLTAAHVVMKVYESLEVEKTSVFCINNPLNNKWTFIDSNNIYYDGVGDIALVKTNIDFTNFPNYPLKLASELPDIGDKCYVCGDPGGNDTLSLTDGVIRDNHFTDTTGLQTSDSLFISAPTITGNSGSPILNTDGEVVGILTFGQTNQETLGGGSNLLTINKSLPKLLNLENNKSKKYLGLNCVIYDPVNMFSLYGTSEFDNKGVVVNTISSLSPFVSILQQYDVILSATVGSNTYDFGSLPGQVNIGDLMYEYDATTINLSVYRYTSGQVIELNDIPFTTTYNDVPEYHDGPLQSGLSNEKQLNKKLYNPLKTIGKKIKFEK